MADKKIKEVSYIYKITMAYLLNGKEYSINQTCIKMVVINYEYNKAHAPLALVKVSLLSKLYNKMQNNQDKGKVVLTIKKMDEKNKTPTKYIKKDFSYYFPKRTYSSSNPIINDNDGSSKVNDDMAFVNCVIALLDISAMNNNKKLINNLYKGANAISIIHQYTSNMNMIIEPFDYNKSMKLCYIVPLEGVTRLLDYLDSKATFYKTGYRFFMDYKYTYLLSNSNGGIDIDDNTYTTVQIEVVKDIRYQTMGIDDDNKIYLIRVQDTQTDVDENQTLEKRFSKVIGFSAKGSSSSASIDLHNEDDSSKSKPRVIRVENDNFNRVDEIKGMAESTGNSIVINMNNVDTSLLVPYKEFILKFHKGMKELNGKYILVAKREVFYQESEGEFRISVTLTLRKKVS